MTMIQLFLLLSVQHYQHSAQHKMKIATVFLVFPLTNFKVDNVLAIKSLIVLHIMLNVDVHHVILLSY